MDSRLSRCIGAIGCALLVVGCAGSGGTAGPAAPAPVYQAGDRWVYRAEDGFLQRVTWEETHEVTAASPQGITIRVSAKGPTINDQRTEMLSGPGTVVAGAIVDNETRRFEPALIRYRFPLSGGERWTQRMRDLDHDSRPYGGIERSVSVGGYEKITTPAGAYDAIRLNVILRLDDETFWRWPTDCTYSVWYAPAVGASVRERKQCWYSEKGGLNGGGRITSQNATVELISSTRR